MHALDPERMYPIIRAILQGGNLPPPLKHAALKVLKELLDEGQCAHALCAEIYHMMPPFINCDPDHPEDRARAIMKIIGDPRATYTCMDSDNLQIKNQRRPHQGGIGQYTPPERIGIDPSGTLADAA